jgi:hypothetical protein
MRHFKDNPKIIPAQVFGPRLYSSTPHLSFIVLFTQHHESMTKATPSKHTYHIIPSSVIKDA